MENLMKSILKIMKNDIKKSDENDYTKVLYTRSVEYLYKNSSTNARRPIHRDLYIWHSTDRE